MRTSIITWTVLLLLCISRASLATQVWPFFEVGPTINYSCARNQAYTTPGPPIIDQHNQVSAAFAATTTIATISATYSNEIILVFPYGISTPTGSIGDGANLSWTHRKAVASGSGGANSAADYYWALSPNCLTNDPITVTLSGGSGYAQGFIVVGIAGVKNTAAPFDANAVFVASENGTSSAPGAVSYTTDSPADLLVTVIVEGQASTNTPPTPSAPTGFASVTTTGTFSAGLPNSAGSITLADKSVTVTQNTSLTWGGGSVTSHVTLVDALVGNPVGSACGTTMALMGVGC